MSTTIVADIMNGVNSQINVAIGQNVAAVMSTIAPFFFACLSLYIVYRVFQYMYEPPDIPVMDVVKMAGSLALVTAFAFSSNLYMQDVVPFVLGAGDDIARAISGATTVADQLDKFIDNLGLFINNEWTSLPPPLTDFGMFMQGCATIIMVMVGAIPFIVISFAYLMMSKIMVALLLSVGPIFICFAFFPSTRDNFKQWTGQCLNYIVLVMLYSTAFSLEMSLIAKYAVIDPNAGLNFTLCLQLAIVMLVFVAVTKEIPTLASQLAGGVGISGLAGNFAGGALGAAAGGLGAAGLLAGKKGGKFAANQAKKGVQAAWDRYKGKGKVKAG